MEDSTANTITYLRARLLAERSVSRTAKQRANELAKRVIELEKQLKFVSLQRRKAEKATVDVLAILENHGRNDLSEPFDSSSDQEEVSSDFKDGNKHVETSKHGKVRESDTEGFSGSEVESSSVNGRSLSWKSSKNSSSRFLEKYMDASRRRRNSFASTGSSPRRVGKSCRQIRHKEHRSVADGSQNIATTAHREDEGRSSSEGVQNSADVATDTWVEEHKTREEKSQPEISTSLCNGHVSQNNGTQSDMERALEHQAQFIAQYEAEENEQREWEDKFRENNGSTRDSCDPGTHSDVTEERDEVKTPPPAPAPPSSTDKLTSRGQETEDDVPDVNFSEEPKIDTEPLLDQKNHDTKNNVLDDRNYPPDLQGTENTPRNVNPARTSSQGCSLSSREEQASDKPHEPTLEARENPDQLGSVLEALQQAKLSLKQNLNKFPLLENEPHRSGDKFPLLESGPSVPAYKSSDKFPIPFSPASLFRLPTDYEYGGGTTRANSLTFDSRLSLTNYPTDTSGGQFISSPYREPVSRLAESGRFISSPFRESRSRSAASLDDQFRMVPAFPYQETRVETPTRPTSGFNPRSDAPPPVADPRFSAHPSALDQGSYLQRSATDPRSDVPPSVLDPRFSVHPSAVDPRLSLRASDPDPRLDPGMGRATHDPRLDPGMGRATHDPRLDRGLGRRAYDPRLDTGTGRTAYDPRLDTGMGRTAYDPRLDLGMGRGAYDPRLDLGMGRGAYDPRLDLGIGRASYDPRLDAGMGRSLYDDYSRRNT